jgi:hypothetical protein
VTAHTRILDEAPGVVASVERINAWLAIATAGSEFVYATLAQLPRGAPGAARMRKLAEAGEVDLFQRRTDVPGQRDYVARRRATAVQRPAPAMADPELPEEAQRLLAMLRGVARKKLPCPTDKTIARTLGVSIGRAAKLVGQLRRAGAIKIETVRAPQQRVVTVVGTGERTVRRWG